MSDQTNTLNTNRRSGGFVAGAILILVGLLSLVSNLPGINLHGWFLPALGLVFLAAGIFQRKFGLLIPGGILLGIGAGSMLIEGPFHYMADPARGGLFLVVFGAGFALISLAGLLVNRRTLWPFIPGGIMAAIGLALMAGEPGLEVLKFASFLWPIALIAFGAYLILRKR